MALALLAAAPLGGATGCGPGGDESTTTIREARMIIEGTISAPGLSDRLPVAELIVRVLDVSGVDGPSETVVEQVGPDPVLTPGQPVAFRLELPAGLDPRRSYILWVHADVDGSGDVTVGDRLTTVSYPVTVDRPQPPLAVELTEVTG